MPPPTAHTPATPSPLSTREAHLAQEAVATRLGITIGSASHGVDDTAMRDAVRELERTQNAQDTVDAHAYARRFWVGLHPFAGHLLLSAARGNQPVPLRDLLTQAPNELANLTSLLNLLAHYPADEPLWDPLAGILSGWLDEQSTTVPATVKAQLHQPRPMSDHAVRELLMCEHEDADTLVLNSHAAGHVTLTDEQLRGIMTDPTSQAATAALHAPAVRARLSDHQVRHALVRVDRRVYTHVAAALLRDPAIVDRADTVAVMLLAEANEKEVMDWLIGHLPLPPAPQLVQRVAAAAARVRSDVEPGNFFGPGRPVDNFVETYGHQFDLASLERPGVADLLEHAPLAVVEEAYTRRRPNVFATLLDQHLDGQPGDHDKARAVIPTVSSETQPDTVTELVGTALALTA